MSAQELAKKYPFIQLAIRRLTFVKFFVIGGFCGILDLILLYFFTDILGVWYFYSGILSFFLVSLISFFLNSNITFQGCTPATNKKSQYVKYTAVILVGMAINNFFLFLFTDIIGVWYIISRIFSSLIALSWNYTGSKKYIFASKN